MDLAQSERQPDAGVASRLDYFDSDTEIEQEVKVRLQKGFARAGTQSAIWAAVLSMLCPWSALQAANQPAIVDGPKPQVSTTDIALGEGGVLIGQVIAKDGSAKSAELVTIEKDGQVIVRATSDDDGHFSVAGLSGGLYQVQAAGQMQSYRLWTAESAPPVAQSQLAVYEGQQVVRGQMGAGLFSCPWFWVGLVAAGIAIPLALDDDDDGS